MRCFSSLLPMLFLASLMACGASRSVPPQRAQEPAGNVYLERGYAYLQQRQWDRAIDEFRRAVERDPDLALAHAALGWAYYQAGRPELALKEGEEVLRLEPDNAQVRQLVELLREQLRRAPPRNR